MSALNIQTCGRCGQQWINAHYCPAQQPAMPLPSGAVIARQLTEADVRRIVREELDRRASTDKAPAERGER